tara:strand:+ start:124 stop:342 length:219 start_codon:yes stop_codon:yes gene_type:complete
MQRIFNIISAVSFLLVLGITGGGVFGYLWITSEKTQEKLKQQLMEQVTGSLKMPGLSGPVLPTATPKALPKF